MVPTAERRGTSRRSTAAASGVRNVLSADEGLEADIGHTLPVLVRNVTWWKTFLLPQKNRAAADIPQIPVARGLLTKYGYRRRVGDEITSFQCESHSGSRWTGWRRGCKKAGQGAIPGWPFAFQPGDTIMNIAIADLILIDEAASIAGCSTRAMYDLVAAGKAPQPIRIGGASLYSEPEIRSWA